LGYANVLEIPNEETFATPAWNQPLPRGEVLKPFYAMAQKMLGSVRNPFLWKADKVLQQMAGECGQGATFRATEVGVYFDEEGKTMPDPYFNGTGPQRTGCLQCGACMVGCRYNAKNTLPKNYLYFAEQRGARVVAEAEVTDVRPRKGDLTGGRYEVEYRSSTGWLRRSTKTVHARHVIFSAGVMGTMKLLLNLRDVKRSLPDLSPCLGNRIRTNSEALLGSIGRKGDVNYSKGVSITSIYNVDEVTRVEPVRYPDGSSLMRLISAPLVDLNAGVLRRIWDSVIWTLRHPLDFAHAMFLPGWAHNATILLVMQNVDNHLRIRLGRSLYTLGRRGLVAQTEPGYEVNAQIKGSHDLVRTF
jgi:cholesterol oxidase